MRRASLHGIMEGGKGPQKKEVSLLSRVRKVLATVFVSALLLAAMAAPALAQVPLHQHFLDTPGTTALPGQGLSASCEETPPAPQDPAFENLHENFHLGAGSQGFTQERNPVSLRVEFC
jgi:hypothetical protein